jgi:1-aminocyclopropane-1-carboxylate deaminase
MYLPISNITLDKLESDLLSQKEITLSILRLDKIHADVSGNKLFKLHYYIDECLQTSHKTMLTFGGAYSNHLVATAFLCNEKGIKSIGIVRGEAAENLTHTLQRCKELGMQLVFVSRDDYNLLGKDNSFLVLQKKYGACTIVPEGGYGFLGAKGASLIMDILKKHNPSHVCACVGTATTLAGLYINIAANEKIIAVPAIKNMIDIFSRIKELIDINVENELIVFNEHHFGGYAKYTQSLITFMNEFYTAFNIPTDIVYTGKMMYTIMEKINNNYFEKGSNIICLHTGGLQGNASLPIGTLIF